MSCTDASKTGTGYVWGANWKTPAKEEMDPLLNTDKVSCSYCQVNGVWCFKFTGLEEGYTDNSLFLPSEYYEEECAGIGNYWSSTVNNSMAYTFELTYFEEECYIEWCIASTSTRYLVRPVLSD